ncbi:MAG: adenylate/guanylate cyclase domain-containing protein [Trueperaceae bacterium]
MNCASCNTANPPQARFCIMCGEQLRTAGSRERRRVSVVFIDLTAFTTLTLGFDPEELRDLADEVLTVVAGVIEDYDGYVDAFRGDGLIALFGAPRSHPDDPQRAVLAAAAGLRAIETIGRAKGYPLKGRAGVNTGIVIAGAVGSGRVRDYTVMGSTVNLAARLEAAAIPGEVWVGPDTFESSRHRLVYELSPPVRLAGFPNVRHAYRLVSTLEQHNVDPYAHLEFVGRVRELELLEARFSAVREDGRSRELRLNGEPGSGKTRLLREVAKRLADKGARTIWITGNSGESDAFTQLSRQLLSLEDGEESRVRQQKALQALQGLLPGESRQHELILASLGLFTPRAVSSSTLRGANQASSQADSKATSQAVSRAWSTLLVATAAQAEAGTLLAVDSTSHDPQLLELLKLLPGAQAPLLLIRTSRDRTVIKSAVTEGAVTDDYDALALEPLGLEASVALLNQLANPILRVATESLIFQVSGVPAYIIELGRALSSTRSGSFSGSLASLLQARLDLLTPAERQLLSLAAVSGERTWERLLLDLSDGSADDRLLRLLSENLLVTEASSGIPGMVAYRFQSELLRHAVMRMIPFGDRPLLHLRVAGWLEQHAPLALSELIGFHFAEGGSPESAYPHYLAAGDLAAGDLAASHGDSRYQILFEMLLGLELPAGMLAQGKLAYAQAALAMGEPERAETQLDEGDAFIDDANPDLQVELREVQRSLRADLQALRSRASQKWA